MAGQALEATRIPGQQDRGRAFQGERSFEMTTTHSEESVTQGQQQEAKEKSWKSVRKLGNSKLINESSEV